MLRLSVDVGGTFTDIVVYDEEARKMFAYKVSTDPQALESMIMNAIRKFKIDIRNVEWIGHATTLATNALIEGKTAKTGLITTRNFKDVLECRRANWFEYDWRWHSPPMLVKRRHIKEITERTTSWGEITTPMNEDDIQEAVEELKKEKIEAIAIVLLNSYINPTNEMRAKELVVSLYPEAYVCTSYEVQPQWKEYERTSTTVVNAALMPIVSRYERTYSDLRKLGFKGRMYMALSDGGCMGINEVMKKPVLIAESGPAMGCVLTAYLCGLLGHKSVISYDMGGTTAKAGLVVDGEPVMSMEFLSAGSYVIRAPIVDVVEIGAGGGSICWIDSIGMVKVGPRSAGAVPGPVCYDKGGMEPTVTDADMVLGILNPKKPLAGEIMPNQRRAYDAIRQKIAEPLNMNVYEAAEAIVKIVDNNMAEAIKIATLYKGYDPRTIPMFAFGGAGPVHAPSIRKNLGIPFIIVPWIPGLASAVGLLVGNMMYNIAQTYLTQIDVMDYQKVEEIFSRLEQNVQDMLGTQDEFQARLEMFRQVDMRFVGQTHEITVALQGSSSKHWASAVQLFHKLHMQKFGTVAEKGHPVEIVNLRVRGMRKFQKPELKPLRQQAKTKLSNALIGEREVWFDGKFVASKIYDRSLLCPGTQVEGPAVIEQFDSTVPIPAKVVARIDEYSNIIEK